MPISGVSNRTPTRVTGGEGTSTRITGGEFGSVTRTPPRTPTRVSGGESTSPRTPTRVTGGEATQPVRIPVEVSTPAVAVNPFSAWARFASAVWSFWTGGSSGGGSSGGSSRRVTGTE